MLNISFDVTVRASGTPCHGGPRAACQELLSSHREHEATGPTRCSRCRSRRRVRMFVMTLGCSRKSVRLLSFRSSSQIWAELHEKAFRRLGGTTRLVVLDNLREGVLAPDIYDPTLNPLYADMLQH